MIGMVGEPRDYLKKFKESEESFNDVGLSRFNIYFKIRSYKFLTKFLVFRNSFLSSVTW